MTALADTFAAWWNRLAAKNHKLMFRNSREAREFVRRLNNQAVPTPQMVEMRRKYVAVRQEQERRAASSAGPQRGERLTAH